MDKIQDLYISLSHGDGYAISILVAIVVVFFTIVYFTCRSSNTRRCVILVGVCEAGKTLLFTRLLRKQYVETFTSIKENSGTHKVAGNKNTTLGLVDIPGHERLRLECVDKYKARTRALIFVIDSNTIQKEIKDVSQYLFLLLTDKTIHQNNPALLIVCNKQDHTLAKGAKVIQTMLEKEITRLRVTQSAALDSTTGASSNTPFIGKKGKDFAFGDLKMRVEFCECSAKGNKDCENADVQPVEDWLAKVA